MGKTKSEAVRVHLRFRPLHEAEREEMAVQGHSPPFKTEANSVFDLVGQREPWSFDLVLPDDTAQKVVGHVTHSLCPPPDAFNPARSQLVACCCDWCGASGCIRWHCTTMCQGEIESQSTPTHITPTVHSNYTAHRHSTPTVHCRVHSTLAL